jgi:hypothetical protein
MFVRSEGLIEVLGIQPFERERFNPRMGRLSRGAAGTFLGSRRIPERGKRPQNQTFFGGGKETRTPDPYAASVMLYQLSYAPIGLTAPQRVATRPTSWRKVRLLRTLVARSVSAAHLEPCHPERRNVILSAVEGRTTKDDKSNHVNDKPHPTGM